MLLAVPQPAGPTLRLSHLGENEGPTRPARPTQDWSACLRCRVLRLVLGTGAATNSTVIQPQRSSTSAHLYHGACPLYGTTVP